ncbi:hypothetical protein F4778DRAFT_442980 [Xylariomycetidae sp. FL2044]|nr:hypothetical protein F4778DRAFT_442980 [Xylariomycetidae sp. FL2044]
MTTTLMTNSMSTGRRRARGERRGVTVVIVAVVVVVVVVSSSSSRGGVRRREVRLDCLGFRLHSETSLRTKEKKRLEKRWGWAKGVSRFWGRWGLGLHIFGGLFFLFNKHCASSFLVLQKGGE